MTSRGSCRTLTSRTWASTIVPLFREGWLTIFGSKTWKPKALLLTRESPFCAMDCSASQQPSEGPVYWRRQLTASIGVAVYPIHMARRGSTDLKKNLLLRAADQAMYAAKDDGKNAVRVAEE